MLTIEITRNEIPIETKDSPDGEGDVSREKVTLTPNIDGILQTVNRLPDGHYLTLKAITRVMNKIVADCENNITSSQIADFLAFELCNAKESNPKEPITDAVLKGHKIVECLIDEFALIFDEAPSEAKKRKLCQCVTDCRSNLRSNCALVQCF